MRYAILIVHSVFFLLSILVEVALVRHHRKEKRFGPSPNNDYTSGYAKKGLLSRVFRRNKQPKTDTLPIEHAHPAQLRQSDGTERTAVADDNIPGHTKYESGYGYEATPEVYNNQPTRPLSQAPLQTQNHGYEDGVYTRA